MTTINRTTYNNRKIEYIVIHYFGAIGGSAEQTCAYFKNVNRKASAHYFVDDLGVWQCVEDKNASWHCGDAGRGAFKGKCMNANSIGIETRPYKVDSTHVSAADTDWFFHDETVSNLVELVKMLMSKHGIDADHVIRHYDVTCKSCPRPWLGDDINTHYGKSGNALWAEFKARLTNTEVEDDEMLSYEQFKEYMNQYIDELSKQPEPDWSKKEGYWDAATQQGIVNGQSPQGYIRRCELTAVEGRMGLIKK